MAAPKSRNTRMPLVPGGASKCLRYVHTCSQAGRIPVLPGQRGHGVRKGHRRELAVVEPGQAARGRRRAEEPADVERDSAAADSRRSPGRPAALARPAASRPTGGNTRTGTRPPARQPSRSAQHRAQELPSPHQHGLADLAPSSHRSAARPRSVIPRKSAYAPVRGLCQPPLNVAHQHVLMKPPRRHGNPPTPPPASCPRPPPAPDPPRLPRLRPRAQTRMKPEVHRARAW